MTNNDILIESYNLHSILSSQNGPVFVLNDVSMLIKTGKVIGIIGESGSGKTQLMMSLTGMQELTPGPFKGEIKDGSNFVRNGEFKFNKIYKKNFEKIKKTKIGFIPQDPRTCFNPYLTLETHFKLSFNKKSSLKNIKNLDLFIQTYCKKVDLDSKMVKGLFPHELSGGMAQRAMIAFILSWQPEIIIGDECTTGLDVSRQMQIINILKEILQNEKKKVTLVLISHDIGFLHHLVDEYFVMYGGYIVEYISDKKRLSTTEKLHPYTLDLLESLLPNSNTRDDKFINELTSSVQLTNKQIACPYVEKCTLIDTLGSNLQNKCRNGVPMEYNLTSKINQKDFDLSICWKRCWVDK